MHNPVLVEVLRGAIVESRHTGAIAVVDADGGQASALGDVARPIFPRSAVKALQALPLIESGAADRFGLAPEELALACASHGGEPGHVATAWHVAGTGRFCTEVMQALGARAFVKTGAEGVFCAALPDLGLGIAVKCDDGAGRAAEVMMAATLARYLPADAEVLARFIRPALRNWNGIAVGSLRPTDAI